MRRSNIVWDERTLDRFLTDPAKAVPGTSMAYAGLPDARERADLIAWLRLASMARRCTAGAARDLQTHNASEAYSAGERR
jgi:cytochrome c